MKSYFLNIKAWWSNRTRNAKIGIIGGAVVVLFVVIGSGKESDGTIETVRRQALARTVQATGTVVSSTDLSLSFQTAQTVRSISTYVGHQVKAGTVLAQLNNANERATAKSANASLLAARARYNKVLEGATSEEVALAQVALNNAKADKGPEVAKQKLYSDGLVAKPSGSVSAASAPTVSGTYRGTEGEYRLSYSVIDNDGDVVRYSGLESGVTRVSTTVPQPLGTKGLFITFPSTATFGNDMRWTITIPNLESPVYTANATAYQAAVDAYNANVATAEAQLAVKRANARQSDVDLALADILTAQAAVDAANAALEKTIIRAPADGTVTRIDINIGDLVEANKPVIVVQDVSNMYIEAEVNESNIASVAIGQPVTVTYDALSGQSFTATVSSVDLSPTISDGIVNYQFTALVTDISTVKTGMTANLSIQTAYKPEVLVIPDRVITEENGVKTVEVYTDERRGKTEIRTITTGLRGDGGLIEVTSGLAEGERIKFSLTE